MTEPIIKKPRGRPFQKGQSGNPGGRHKGIAEVMMLARQCSEQCIAGLLKIANNEKAPAQARVAAYNSLLDRGLGKPTQGITIGPKTESFEEMSDAELRAIAATGDNNGNF